MKIHQETCWAGTESSLRVALDAEETISERLAAGVVAQSEREAGPRLLEVQDGVGVISIKGSLNNDDDPFWNEMFGMTGYPEIREALVAAADDPAVKNILLDIDSGGGAVSGVDDTAQLIRLINDDIKPVATFTDGVMASAAYWLGCAAGDVSAGKSAVVGSIGIISTHMERSQALKNAGIGVTVVRAGKYKALANSVEPLSAEGRQQIQNVVDAAYTVFVDHVANMRGKTYDYADQTMAQGQEFIGAKSADVGLVDRIETFDDVMGRLKGASIDASNNFMENRGKPKSPLGGDGVTVLSGETDMKKTLTAQAVAALAAGAVAPAVVEAAVAAVAADVGAGPGDAAAAAGAAAEAGTENVATEGAATETVAEQSAVVTNVDTSATAVQLLTAQLKEKDQELLSTNVKLAKLEEKMEASTAILTPMLEVVCQSCNNLRVALSGSAIDMSKMDPASVLAEHKSLSEQFTAKFKVGGVAAVSAEPAKAEVASATPFQKARVQATRFSK